MWVVCPDQAPFVPFVHCSDPRLALYKGFVTLHSCNPITHVLVSEVRWPHQRVLASKGSRCPSLYGASHPLNPTTLHPYVTLHTIVISIFFSIIPIKPLYKTPTAAPTWSWRRKQVPGYIGSYRDCIGIMEKKMETTILYGVYIGSYRD